jgi:sugar fermentation stimulation protein A
MMSIKLEEKFQIGTFLERINRFMVKIELDGKEVLAHLPNSGRLSAVLFSSSKAFLLERCKPERKSRFDLFAIEKGNIPIIVDTRFSNFAAKKVVEQGVHSLLKGYKVAKENVQVNNSRLDMLLQRGTNDFFIEVKSVTHVVNYVALFPDAPTLRGRRHISHLIKLAEQGYNAAILFSVQRPDARILKPNRETDPEFAALLKKAIDNHVEILVHTLVFNYGKHATVEIVPNAPQFMI